MSFTCLRDHIVTATYRRRRVIDGELEEIIYGTIRKRAGDLEGKVLHIGGVADHIHFIASIPPTIALSEFIGSVKAESSRVVNRRLKLAEDFAWQRSFGAFTCDPKNMTGIIHYVENQKIHHANKDIWPDYERMRAHKAPPNI